MPVHTVKSGECLTKIAADHGFGDYKMIYDHPANAEFRKLRPNPHVIQAGDQLFIPETVPLKRTFATGKRHTVVIKRPRARLQVYVQDADGEPLRGKSYVLKVEGQDDKKGSTDGEGLVAEDIPPAATAGRLELSAEGFTFELRLGGLDPLASSTGVAARLRNLGYACPARSDEGVMAETIRYALARFQADHDLPPSGQLDAATTELLRQTHDHGEKS
jgi:hypothetical protein